MPNALPTDKVPTIRPENECKQVYWPKALVWDVGNKGSSGVTMGGAVAPENGFTHREQKTTEEDSQSGIFIFSEPQQLADFSKQEKSERK